MTLSWWGSAFVALLALMLAAVGFAAWCAWQTRLARADAQAAEAAARRVAAWCGIPEWWVPMDRWPKQRPPNDRASVQARWDAYRQAPPTLDELIDPPQGDLSWSALQQAAAAEHASTEQLPTLADVVAPDRPPYLRYRPLRVDELGGGEPR